MESSILTSTKKILGIAADYEVFDLDIITHINAALSVVNQIIGEAVLVFVEDAEASWDDIEIPIDQLNLLKTYVFLKVRLLFDPPATSFGISAIEKVIEEFEWRLNVQREEILWALTHPVVVEIEPV